MKLHYHSLSMSVAVVLVLMDLISHGMIPEKNFGAPEGSIVATPMGYEKNVTLGNGEVVRLYSDMLSIEDMTNCHAVMFSILSPKQHQGKQFLLCHSGCTCYMCAPLDSMTNLYQIGKCYLFEHPHTVSNILLSAYEIHQPVPGLKMERDWGTRFYCNEKEVDDQMLILKGRVAREEIILKDYKKQLLQLNAESSLRRKRHELECRILRIEQRLTNDFPKIQNELLMRKKQLQQHRDRIASSLKIWFESPNPTNVPCMDVPCLFRAHPCQEHLLASSNNDFMVQADLVFRIRNDSKYWFRFGKELQMCGYYNLELDMRLSDGNIFHLKRKDGIWYRNFIEEESIRGEKEYRCLVSLDRRLWNGMPPRFINKIVEVRPRFAFFYFEKEGRRYKSIDDMKSNVETRIWNHSRIGELIGDWCETPVSPHMSAQ